MKLCAVAWCAAFATKGDHCPVHAIDPKLRPEELAADEEFVPSLAPCEKCHGKGECENCNGTGECEHDSYRECHDCGHKHRSHECGCCDGLGKCLTCHGEGRVTFKKKEATA